jgi:hypothetical protein
VETVGINAADRATIPCPNNGFEDFAAAPDQAPPRPESRALAIASAGASRAREHHTIAASSEQSVDRSRRVKWRQDRCR